MALLIGTSAEAVAHVLTRVARRKVVYVPSVGDAASPVWLVAGGYSRQIGQCADWLHHVERAAESQDALYVEGSYDGSRWVVGIPEEFAEAVCREMRVITVAEEQVREARRHARMVADMERAEAERPAREAWAAQYRAECEARAAEYRPLYDAALARVRRNSKGGPHRGDARQLEWAYRMASGLSADCYGEADRQYGLAVLRRLAGQGFADPVTA